MANDEYRKPGMYMHLYHGFPDAESRNEADGWGEVGPDFGPLTHVHTTYATHVKIGYDPADFNPKKFFEGQTGVEFYTDMFLLDIKDECIFLNGIYYGDWAVYYVK